MGICRRFVGVVLLSLASAFRLAAADPNEQHVFDEASKKLKDGFYQLAEKQFKEFTQTYTNSARIPEAILRQSEALFFQKNYEGAIELLSTRQNVATNLADQFVFLRGEALFRKGDYPKAADTFAKLIKDYPASIRRLEATVREASARAAIGDWPAVVSLLQQTNGIFRMAALTNAGDSQVVQGYLLLGEAGLAQQNPDVAERALDPIAKLLLPATPSWQLNYLLGKIRMSQGKNEEALVSATNMMQKALEANQPALRVETAAFRASVLERLGRNREAIDSYTNNLVPAASPERQRQALLKITELSLTLNDIPGAVHTLKRFKEQFATAPMADLVWLTLGELQLRQYAAALGSNVVAMATNKVAGTNYLQEAKSAFEHLSKEFPQSSLFGQAQLDLGWCFWLQNDLPASGKAFQTAVGRLPSSFQQATAYFKLADAQFRQNHFTNAMSNYMAVIEKFGAFPEVRTNLFEPALYQAARCALSAKQPDVAINAVTKLLQSYPGGYHTDRALLYVGVQLTEQGRPDEARNIFSDLIAAVPDAPLIPQMRLEVARTFEQQEKWPEAIAQYDSWLSTYTNHPARPAALYYQAYANFIGGRETNALTLFTGFIAKYPTNELAPQAQWWVATYYYNQKPPDFEKAESNFQDIFHNWPASELTCRAKMMAGLCAFGRSGWNDAIRFFTTLDTNCPTVLRSQAIIAHADVLISRGPSTNKILDYQEAINVLNALCQSSATNTEVDLAWGRLASCYLNLAHLLGQKDSITNASADLQKLIDSPRATALAKTIARVGLGVVFEAQAQQKNGDEQAAALKKALENYLEVFYDEKGPADPFWVKEAGLNAGRVAENLQWWSRSINVYKRLKELLPTETLFFDSRIQKAEEQLPTAKN